MALISYEEIREAFKELTQFLKRKITSLHTSECVTIGRESVLQIIVQ